MFIDDIVNFAYTIEEYPVLASFTNKWSYTKPFSGLKILVATPIFKNTLLQYRALIFGGAQLSVGLSNDSNKCSIPYDDSIIQLLRENNIEILSPKDVSKMESNGIFFDLILDCAVRQLLPIWVSKMNLAKTYPIIEF